MKRVFALSVAVLIALSAVAFAGGDKKMEGKKMEGTVAKVDTTEKMMLVKDKDGKEWSIYWTDSTKMEGGELKEGETIHFKANEKEGKMWATWVHVGEQKKM